MEKRACRLDLDILGVHYVPPFTDFLWTFLAPPLAVLNSVTQRVVRNIPQLLAVIKSFVFVTPSQLVVVVTLAAGGGRNKRGEKRVARLIMW